MPERGALKFREECRQDHPQVIGIQRIGLQPLNERAARRETRLRGTIKLAREQRCDSGNPWIRRLGNDQVVSFARGEKKIACVVEGDVHARIVEHVAVELHKQRRGGYHGRFDFDDIQALEFGIACQSGRGHPAAESDQKHAARRVRERAEMPQ